MKLERLKQSIEVGILYKLILSVIIILVCFPPVEITYSIGIDPSLSWVFNHLFKTGLENGRNIIFAQGPLYFFIYPLQENLIFVLIITAILQFGIIYNLFSLTGFYDKKEWLLPVLFSVILLKVFNFKFLILTNISLFYLLHYLLNKIQFKYAGLVLTAFALYVNVYVAFISATITASFLFIELYRHRKFLLFARDIIIFCLLILLIWLLMYKSFHGFFRYFYGIFNLAADNSAAVSLYPDNNRLLILLFIFSVFLIPFFQRTPKAYYFGFLFTLSLFAAWKHGMAREDISHARSLFIYAFMLMSLFILFYKERLPVNIIIIGIGLTAFYLNLRNLPTYYPSQIELLGINNFYDLATGYSSIKEKANKTIENNLVTKKLPRKILDDIGTGKVDVYPWDYSIIPANSLNWQPRPVIQSFVSYTSWLDKQNARHFNSDEAPEFLIWDLNKLTKDLNGGSMESVDNRFLLNDEPGTILQIIKNYELRFKNKSFLVLEKRNNPLYHDSHIIGPVNVQWGTWINIPEGNGELLRAEPVIKKNFPGKIKSFFYKDEESWIYCKDASGNIFKYKIIPKNARDGLWINPFIFRSETDFIYPEIKSIMLKTSNKNLMKREIQFRWEIIDFKVENDSILYSFFNKTTEFNEKQVINVTNTFDLKNYYWNNEDPANYIPDSYLGSTSYLLTSETFSPTYSLDLDTIAQDSILVQAGCWIKGPDSHIGLIISVENKNKIVIYHAIDLHEQIIEASGWNHIYSYLHWDNSKSSEETILKIYIWNTSKNNYLIDDFNVNLTIEKSEN